MTRTWEEIKQSRPLDAEGRRAYERTRWAIDIGARVRAERLARGLSQTKLAAAAGTSQAAIARLEAGGVEPTVPLLRRVASALGLELVLELRGTNVRRRAAKKPARGARVVKKAKRLAPA